MQPGESSSWRQRLPVIILELLVLCAVFLRFVKLGHESLNYDELASVWVSRLPAGQLVSRAIASGHPPAFNLLTHFWPLPPGSEVWARVPSAFIGILIVPLAYITGKEIGSRPAGIWAAAFSAFSPLMIWYSRDATSYGWLMLVCLLSFYFLARSSRRGGWGNWALYVLAVLLAIFTYFLSFILVLAGLAVYPLLRRAGKSNLRGWAVSHAFLAAALAIFFVLTRSATAGRSGLSVPSLTNLIKDIINWPVVFVRGYANETIGGGVLGAEVSQREAVIAAAVIAAILISLIAARRVRQLFFRREIIAASIYVLFLVIGPVAVQLAAPGSSFASRYYSWAAPVFAVLLALLLTSLPGRVAWLGGVPLIAAMLFYSGTEIKVRRNEAWRTVFSIVAKGRQKDDGYLCFPEVHCVVAAAFYLPQVSRFSGGDIENGGADMSEKTWAGWTEKYPFLPYRGGAVEDKISRDLSSAARVWLIIGDGAVGNYPASPLVRGIMRKDWKQAGNWDLPPLDLGLFVKPQAAAARLSPRVAPAPPGPSRGSSASLFLPLPDRLFLR